MNPWSRDPGLHYDLNIDWIIKWWININDWLNSGWEFFWETNLGSEFVCGSVPYLTRVWVPYRSCAANWISSFSKTKGMSSPAVEILWNGMVQRGRMHSFHSSGDDIGGIRGCQCASGSTSRWLWGLRVAAAPCGEGVLWTDPLDEGGDKRRGRLSGVRVQARARESCVFFFLIYLLIMLLQLSHFPPHSTPSCPPPSLPHSPPPIVHVHGSYL